MTSSTVSFFGCEARAKSRRAGGTQVPRTLARAAATSAQDFRLQDRLESGSAKVEALLRARRPAW
jgi:hypothetical protein